MEVGKVNSKHLILSLKVNNFNIHESSYITFAGLTTFPHYSTLQVKSVLDPCEDENNDNEDDEISLGADSVQKDEDSESDSEVIGNCICSSNRSSFWFF